MGKTKRKGPRREFEISPNDRHVIKRRCDLCHQWYALEDLVLGEDMILCGDCDAAHGDSLAPQFVEDD